MSDIYMPLSQDIVLIFNAHACSQGSGEPVHLRSLARALAASIHKELKSVKDQVKYKQSAHVFLKKWILYM